MNLARVLPHLRRRLRAAVAEAHYAQTRLLMLRLAYDRYLPEPDAGPADYAEFLLRSSGPLRHEPAARSGCSQPPAGEPATP